MASNTEHCAEGLYNNIVETLDNYSLAEQICILQDLNVQTATLLKETSEQKAEEDGE